MINDTTKREADTTSCWYLKDYADGWIKYYDTDLALLRADETGALLVYSPKGVKPEFASLATPAVPDDVKRAITVLDIALDRLESLEDWNIDSQNISAIAAQRLSREADIELKKYRDSLEILRALKVERFQSDNLSAAPKQDESKETNK